MLSVEKVYENIDKNSSYQGIVLKQGFDEYLSTCVRENFYDIEGTESLIKEFSDINLTGFEKELLVDIFSTSPPVNNWKIGESLAECYLKDFEKVRFYYSSSRDAKNPKANLQGADLVGFIDIDEETTIFLFGEVKTSGDKNSPPQVMYNETGMIEQLRNIKNQPELRKSIIKWLGFKVKDLPDDSPFKGDYEKALNVYIKEGTDKYFLFGVLIRDTEPKETDLKSRYEFLKEELSCGIQLKLLALYIPIPIKDMKKFIINKGEEK